MDMWKSESTSLAGALAPVFDERNDHDLAVEGTIPACLRGVFMRNGPNPQFQPDDHYIYPFDGTGMIHAIYLEKGSATYRNRWVQTRELTDERTAGHRLYNSGFAGPPNANLANTNIIHHEGRYLALYEAGTPYEVDEDLNTLGTFNYAGNPSSILSAHPKIDPVSGELFSVQYDLETAKLVYLRVDKSGKVTRAVPFQSPWPAMVHDISITRHHLVVCICPFVFDFTREGPPATWQPDRGTQIALIPRDAHTASDIQWIKAPPFFNWHTVSAYEDNNRIELVMPWHESFSFTAHRGRLELHRLVIDINSAIAEDQTIDDQPCEFGRINDAYLGKKNQYGYVAMRSPRVGEHPQAGAFEALARYDLVSGAKTVYQFPAGITVGEPVFAPDPNGAQEDDGFILTFTHQANVDTGCFVIFDARHLSAGPIASVHLPRRVPAGLHGSWTPF